MAKRFRIILPYRPRPWQERLHRELAEHRWAVLVVHRRAGKTVACINHLIKRAALNTRRAPRYAYLAPLHTQAKSVAWDYLRYYTSAIPGSRRHESELWVELPNGARIRLFGADNPDSLRGQYFDGVVLDEVAQMKPQVWGEVVRPALADREGFAVFIGTPKGRNLFFDLYQHALADPAWAAETWTVHDTDALSREEIEQAKAQMSQAQFAQEFLCDWNASAADVLIPLPLALAAAKRAHSNYQLQHHPVVMGVDPARFGDDRSAICVRRGLAMMDLISFQGIDLVRLAGEVIAAADRHAVDTIFVDSVGYGAGLLDQLRALGRNAVGVEAGKSFAASGQWLNLRAKMWANLAKWLEEGGSIAESPDLIADLTSLTYSYDVHGRLVLEKKADAKKRGIRSPDLADSLALTFAYPVSHKALQARNRDRPVVARRETNPHAWRRHDGTTN